MKPKDISLLHESIEYMLSYDRLYAALTRIIQEAKTAELWDIVEEASSKLSAYGYLLDYFKRGAEDPQREEMRSRLTEEAFLLNNRLADRLAESASQSVYYSKRKEVQSWAQEYSTIHLLQTLQTRLCDQIAASGDPTADTTPMEVIAEQLFYAIWTNFPYTENDLLVTRQLLVTECVLPHQRELFISALTLNLLQWFDTAKVHLLLDCIEPVHPQALQQRAWVGLALLLSTFPKRFSRNDALRQRISRLRNMHLKEDGTSPLLTLQLQIFQSQEAGRVKQQIEEEITPELRRISADLRQKHSLQQNTPLKINEETAEALNPEWEEQIRKSGLGKKLQEIGHLQQEGTDIMLNTFVGMKHFPFFYKLSNWLLPYTPQHSAVARQWKNNPDLKPMAELFEQLSFLCSSDKYSFFLSFNNIPEAQRKMLTEVIRSQKEEYDGQNGSRPAGNGQAEHLSRCYLHDLYRFFTLNPRHADFRNPFDNDIRLFLSEAVGDWFRSPSALRIIAEYLFRKRRYEDAVSAFKLLYNQDRSEPTLQKLAFAADHQQIPDDLLTEQILEECNLLYPQKEWTLRYLANFYIRRKRCRTAIPFLQEALQAFPNQLNLLTDTAQCFIQQKEFAEALPLLFKADILKEGNPKVEQAIAWCALLTGNNRQAERYIAKVLHHKGSAQAWLNAGHIALQRNDIGEAIRRYLKSLDMPEKWSLEDYSHNMAQDSDDLISAGIDPHLLNMVQESVLKEIYEQK